MLQRGPDLVRRFLDRARPLLEMGLPEGPLADAAQIVGPNAPRRQLLDPDEGRSRRQWAPERERLLERPDVERARDRRIGGEDRLRLAGEVQAPAVPGD